MLAPSDPLAQVPGANARTVVVASDLHMGVGRQASGEWHAYEDFRWTADFTAFLDALNADGRGAVDLILNGDTFELLQSTEADCQAPAEDLGCTEPQALARLRRVLAAHDAEMKALGQFARKGSNRVVLVPGDHDAALLFPGVGRLAVAALAAPAGRADVAAAGYWLSADGQVYAEHGHQIGPSAHRFENWPAPFLRRGGVEYLARPWGEQAVQDVYNRVEPRFQVVDNLAVTGTGMKYALAAEGMTDAGDAGASLLRYLLFTMSWQQFRMELDDGDVEAPIWDVAQVRAQGPSFLVSSLPDDDRFKPIAAKALADGRLAKTLDTLDDEAIVTVCDYRAAVRRSRRRMEPVLTQLYGRGPVVAECPRTPETRGSHFEYFWRSRDAIFTRRLETVARQLPKRPHPIAAFVHGHTHLPDRAQENANMISGGLLTIAMEGFAPIRGSKTPVAINGGAWQRTITPVQLERRATDRGVAERDVLSSLTPDDLAPCYSFVRVAPYTDAPAPEVRYWRQSAAGEWTVAAACGR